MNDRILLGAATVLGVPAITIGYILFAERALASIPQRRAQSVRPWLWLGPALVLLLVFLVYPSLNTLSRSFLDANSSESVGLANYHFVFTDPTMLTALRNNIIWVVVFTSATVVLGLAIAVLADRTSYESLAKGAIFLPMAISFVAAGVIWRFMYDFRPPGLPQTGVLNAVLMLVVPGFEPQAWLSNNVPFNNLAIIAAAIWLWTGFCMVILSAGLKGIPAELMEAARVDGASELQMFGYVVLPLLGSTIAVVATTMVILALKAFDLVYVMTNGNYDTEVIANRMYKEMFNVHNFGRASAIAVVLLAAIVPIMVFNLRRFRQQEETR